MGSYTKVTKSLNCQIETTGYFRSIHEGVSSAIMNSDCLVFDTSIAQLFADNGNLGINVTISMC